MIETTLLQKLRGIGFAPSLLQSLAQAQAGKTEAMPQRVIEVQREGLTLHDGEREHPARLLPALRADLAAQSDAIACVSHATLDRLVKRDLISIRDEAHRREHSLEVHLPFLQVCLATFTLVFITLHVVVLALDDYAGVGWSGVVLPLGAEYRPLPVTLGWLGLYAGLLAGLTARFAGRLGRLWWPIHHTTLVIYAAVWAHGVLAGTDSAALWFWYAGSALLVVATAISRYMTPRLRSSLGEDRR